MLSNDQIFEDRHSGEQTEVLKGSGDTGLPRNFEAVDLLEQQYLIIDVHRKTTSGRLVEARETVEHSGLTCAVWPDNSSNLSRIGGERQIINCKQAAKTHRQMLDR